MTDKQPYPSPDELFREHGEETVFKQGAENVSDNISTPRFLVISADDFSEGPELEWIIEDVLPEGEIVMITGVSGSGKTFLVIDLVACVALGWAWRGHKVKQGRVVYIAAEGAAGIRKRLKAYKKHHGMSFGKYFGVVNDSPNLIEADDVDLAKSINEAGGASIIVLDTLAQVTPGAKENSSEDMGKALSRCKLLRKATGALIILIHHIGKDESKGARGWSGMKAAMDAEIEVTRKNDDRQARISKQKDGEDGAIFPFTLESVLLGHNANGKAITSCIVKHGEVEPHSKVPKPKGKWQEAVHKAVQGLSLNGEAIPVGHVIDEAIKAEPYDPGANPEKPERDRRREGANRAIRELSKVELIKLEDNKVCLPQIHK